jgi:hypothetical protein
MESQRARASLRKVVVAALYISVLLARLCQCASDCEALAASGWAANAGWTINLTNPAWCCTNQKGVQCDSNGTLVVSLVLQDIGLRGMIHPTGSLSVISTYQSLSLTPLMAWPSVMWQAP